MKVLNTLKNRFLQLSLVTTIAMSSVSCGDYLDVVPPEQASLPDATKSYDASIKFLYSCYSTIYSPYNYHTIEAVSDEYVLPPLWSETASSKIIYNLNEASNSAEWRWGGYYRSIGQIHLFLSEIDKAREVSPEEIKEWKAEAKFLLAYYHMMTLIIYGPCPINDHYIDMDANEKEYPGRSHFDYVVNWIVNKFDEAAVDLPAKRSSQKWGRATSTMAKALKARLLLYAASPLWNGSFPFPNWQNTNFETPGYGKALVSYTYDPQKWVRAKQACEEAISFATSEGGNALYTNEEAYVREDLELPFVPGVNKNTAEGKAFLKKVMLMRYLTNTRYSEGNHEIIWGLADQGNWHNGVLPHHIITKSNGENFGGYSGVSPVLNTSIQYFYTKNGKRPAHDGSFTPESDWYKSANISGRPGIIKLNVNREPRFYAWFAFDDGDFGSKLADGRPLHIELRNADKQGYNPVKYQRDNNVTGYFTQKGIMPKLNCNKNGGWNYENKPRCLIRLAELYLNLAECEAALGEDAQAIEHLNIIRTRAGVPNLTTADLSTMSMTDWVRNERFIELWGEGHRYYDIRRWLIAPQTMAAGTRMGLSAYGKENPTFEEFNTVTPVKQPFQWNNRMYLLPVFDREVYKNPQMVQAPGY